MKILIIKLGALGDVIMSTPVIKKLQEHYIGEEIWLLTSTIYKKLFISMNQQVKISRSKLSNLFSILFANLSSNFCSVVWSKLKLVFRFFLLLF